jgi:hypothetical protein
MQSVIASTIISTLCAFIVHPLHLDCEAINAFLSMYSYDHLCHALVHKPVMKKVCTVPTTMPAEYGVVHQLPKDLLAGMPELPTHPPNFIPRTCFTCDCTNKLDLDPANWLWPEELKLIRWLVRVHECTFTWCASECGCLNETYFLPYKILTVPHTPWSQWNIPIPPAMLGEVICIIKKKIICTAIHQTPCRIIHGLCSVWHDRSILRIRPAHAS